MSTTSTSTQTTPKLSPNFRSIRYKSDLSNYLKPRSNSSISITNSEGYGPSNHAKLDTSSNDTKHHNNNHNNDKNNNNTNNDKLDEPKSISPKAISPNSRKNRKSSIISISPKTKSPDSIDPFLKQYLKDSNHSNYSRYFLNTINDRKSIPNNNHYDKLTAKRNIILIKPKRSLTSSTKITPKTSSPIQLKDQNFKNYDNHYNLIKRTSSPNITLKSQISDSSNDFTKLLPKNFVNCELNDLIILVSRMLTDLIELNDKSVPKLEQQKEQQQQVNKLNTINDDNKKSDKDDGKKKNALTRYHSRTPPNISPLNYLTRLSKFNNFSNATLLTTIYYIDLLSFNYQPFFTLNSWTVHRFLLVATMTCQKSMEDFFFTNDHYAKVGGVNLNELNCLELDFLNRINWKCVPAKYINGKHSIKYSKSVLDLYYNQLVELTGKNPILNNLVYTFNQNDIDQKQIQNVGIQDKKINDGESEIDSEMDSDMDSEADAEDDFNVDDGEDDEEMYLIDNDDDNLGDLKVIDKSKYTNNGFSIDGSSSPHLKRRYENL